MKRSRFSEEQGIRILKEHHAGRGAIEMCRKKGISDATFYKWRSKYGGMDASLMALETENDILKKMLAEQMTDVAKLKEMLGKMYGPHRACKLFDDVFRLRKCIRPLISG